MEKPQFCFAAVAPFHMPTVGVQGSTSSLCYLLSFDNDHPHRCEIVPHGHLTWVSWWLVKKEQSLPPNIQNRKLISRDEFIKVTTSRSQRWDLSPGRKAAGYTCLARMLHCLPRALQAWDHAVFILFFSLSVLLEEFLLTLNTIFRQLVAWWPVYAVDTLCWMDLGISQCFPFVRDSEEFFLAPLCLWVLLIIEVKVAQSCPTLAIPWTIQSTEFSRPEYWSGFSLLQGIFPAQGSNSCLPHRRRILYQLSHRGSPMALHKC